MQPALFRGTKEGLLVTLAQDVDLAHILAYLDKRLAATGDFFRGAQVTVVTGGRTLSPADQEAVAQVLARHGLSLLAFRDQAPGLREGGEARDAAGAREAGPAGGRGEELPRAPVPREEPPLVVSRTLRSGQAVRHRGDVIILGDVNPGAEVVAAGHIIVLGTLRGVAHAGATGDETAFVMALRLQPSQLRIAHKVGRPPEGQPAPQEPEVARIVDGQIVIEGRARG